jgi:hypothetical protein
MPLPTLADKLTAYEPAETPGRSRYAQTQGVNGTNTKPGSAAISAWSALLDQRAGEAEPLAQPKSVLLQKFLYSDEAGYHLAPMRLPVNFAAHNKARASGQKAKVWSGGGEVLDAILRDEEPGGFAYGNDELIYAAALDFARAEKLTKPELRKLTELVARLILIRRGASPADAHPSRLPL